MSQPRVLIVDDEAPARRRLRQLLRAAPDWQVVADAKDVPTAVASVEQARPDVVFLDIRIPGGDGFEVVERVGVDRMPLVVFVTAFDDRALDAFEVGASDYLVKPVTPSRFRLALDRVRERLAAPDAARLTEELTALLQRAGAERQYLERVTVWHGERGRLVAVDAIDYIEAARAHVFIHLGGKRLPLRHSLGELEARLDPRRFQRIHRSHIVRLDAIREVHSWFHGDLRVVLADGTILNWSRRFRCGGEQGHTLD
jgi:two-component system, LytTR family, response regulator